MFRKSAQGGGGVSIEPSLTNLEKGGIIKMIMDKKVMENIEKRMNEASQKDKLKKDSGYKEYEKRMNILCAKLFETNDGVDITITTDERNIICGYFCELWEYQEKYDDND